MNYYQFPKALLNAKVSANVKLCYMLMYDMLRANKANKQKLISQQAYIQVKRKTLAIKMQLSESQTKRILKELKESGLIIAERYGNETTAYYLMLR